MDVFIINAAGDLVQPEKLFTIPAGISVLVLTEKGECMDGGDDAAIIEIAEAISAGEDDIATVLEDLNDTEADFASPINAKVVEGGAQMLDNNLTFKSWGDVKKYKDGEEEDKKITRADVEKHSQSFAHRLRDDEGDPVKKKSDIGKSKKKQTIALSALLTMYAENGSTGLFILDCCRRRLWDNKLFSQEAQRGGRKKKNRRRRRRSHTRRRRRKTRRRRRRRTRRRRR